MKAPLIVSAAALFGCLMPTMASAQSRPEQQDLRAEIRRIVREEVRAALREMHVGPAEAAPNAGPSGPAMRSCAAPMRPGAASSPATKDNEKARVVEKLDGEMGQMNDLIEQIEKIVEKTSKKVEKTTPGERRITRPEQAVRVEEGTGGIFEIKLEEPGTDVKAGAPVEFRFQIEGDGEHGVKARSMHPPAGQNKIQLRAKASRGEEEEEEDEDDEEEEHAQGHKAVMPPKPAKSAPKQAPKKGQQTIILGEPMKSQGGQDKMQLRAKAGRGEEEEEDEDDEEEERSEVRRVAPPRKPNAAPVPPPPAKPSGSKVRKLVV